MYRITLCRHENDARIDILTATTLHAQLVAVMARDMAAAHGLSDELLGDLDERLSSERVDYILRRFGMLGDEPPQFTLFLTAPSVSSPPGDQVRYGVRVELTAPHSNTDGR